MDGCSEMVRVGAGVQLVTYSHGRATVSSGATRMKITKEPGVGTSEDDGWT